MKILLILLGLLLVVFIGIQLFFLNTQRTIETYPYQVEQEFDQFEIRQYEATLFTSVKVPSSDYKKSSGQGFSILAGYIFGKNEQKEKIAMTAPVAMSLGDSMTMMFMVPKERKKVNLPKPDAEQINFTEMPAKRVAAIGFGGWANDEKIKKHKAKLIAAIEAEGIEHTGRFYFLGYNAPFEVFNRRNEVIVDLP
jgi:hypothetical protein